MQEPRAEAERGGDLLRVAYRMANGLQLALVRRVALDIGVDREIVTRPQAADVGGQTGRGAGRSGRGVIHRGEETQRPVFQHRRLVRERTGLFKRLGQRTRGCFAGFDVGLVEGVDVQQGAGDRGCHFPAEEFLSDIQAVGQRNTHHGLARGLQRGECGVVLILAVEADGHEQAVVAVHLGRAGDFGVDGHHAPPTFAGRFGDELFHPRP